MRKAGPGALVALEAPAAAPAAEVIAGLGAQPRTLPCRLLYDAVGSALFEAITHLPEYGLARADRRLLRDHAGAIAATLGADERAGGRDARAADTPLVIELGAGSARKTRPLLRVLAQAGQTFPPGTGAPASQPQAGFDYIAVDISPAALRACRRVLAAVPGLRQWRGIAADFLPGLAQAAGFRAPGQRLVVLFLGSTIGNLTREEALIFLRENFKLLAPGDALLLGTDGELDPSRLLPAYDDAAGVTAAFNRNVLARLQRECGAEIDPPSFAHEARWNAGERRIEMHLRALSPQAVSLPRPGGALFTCHLAAGDTIQTEASYKYTAAEARRLGEAAGFVCAAQWIGTEWPAAETLLARRAK